MAEFYQQIPQETKDKCKLLLNEMKQFKIKNSMARNSRRVIRAFRIVFFIRILLCALKFVKNSKQFKKQI